MNILFVLPAIPWPPDTGGKVKVYNILKHLCRRHKCDLLCFNDTAVDATSFSTPELPNVSIISVFVTQTGLRLFISRLLCMFAALPPSFARYRSAAARVALSNLVQTGKYDAIHFDIINTAWLHQTSWLVRSVHSPNDATSLIYAESVAHMNWGFKKLSAWVSENLLRRYERRNYGQFSVVHVVSEVDANYLRRVCGINNLKVLPICFDFSGLSNDAEPSFQYTGADKTNNRHRIICIGNLGNPGIFLGILAFLSDALPRLIKDCGPLEITILSPVHHRQIDRMLETIPNVSQVDRVDDFLRFIQAHDVCVLADAFGAPGVKTRTLNALASGVPVVGSPIAFSGIPIVDGESGEICSGADDFVVRIRRLLTDHKRSSALAQCGRKLVMEYFSIEILGPQYERLYCNEVK